MRSYFGATIRLEQVDHVGASVSHIFDLTSSNFFHFFSSVHSLTSIISPSTAGAEHCEQIPSRPIPSHPAFPRFPAFSSLFRLLGNDSQRWPPPDNNTPLTFNSSHSLVNNNLPSHFFAIFCTCGAALMHLSTHSRYRPHRLEPFSRDNLCI